MIIKACIVKIIVVIVIIIIQVIILLIIARAIRKIIFFSRYIRFYPAGQTGNSGSRSGGILPKPDSSGSRYSPVNPVRDKNMFKILNSAIFFVTMQFQIFNFDAADLFLIK